MNLKSVIIAGALLFSAHALHGSAPGKTPTQKSTPGASSPSYLQKGGFATLGITAVACVGICLYAKAEFIHHVIKKRSTYFNLFTDPNKGKLERASYAAKLLSSVTCGFVGCYYLGKFGRDYLRKAL